MKIAVTGTIGSGKSLVMEYIKSKGYKTFDTDKYTHQLLLESEVIREISDNFDCIVDGVVSRKKLAEIVFNDSKKLEKLNSIIHPKVSEKIKSLKGTVFVEAPVLFEANMENLFDIIIVISARHEILIKRVMERGNLTKDDVEKRIFSQKSEEFKKIHSNYVIINETSKVNLYKQIDIVLEDINV